MEDKVLAIVNGKKISETELGNAINRFPMERQEYLKTEEGKGKLLEQLISLELVYSYAKENDMENNEYYKSELEMAKRIF